MKGFFVVCSVLLATVQLARSEAIGTCPPDNRYPDVLLPDDQNCTIFYKCNWGVPTLHVCPQGLYFNDVLWMCDRPENVNCDRSQSFVPHPLIDCPVPDGIYTVYTPDRVDCSKFYVCVHGEHVEFTCPDGLLYDGSYWACNYPEYVTCGVYTPFGDDVTAGSNGSGQDGGSTPGAELNTGDDNEGESEDFVPQPLIDCPVQDGKYPLITPDRVDCSKYYVCIRGEHVEFTCPGGLLYDGLHWVCDYPEHVTCGVYAPKSSSEDGGSTPWVGECPEVATTQLVLLASRNDPTKFYSCVGNTPYELSCPSGLVFNVNLQVCDYPQ